MRYAFKIAYDGRYYNGFARQPDQRTVEGEIIRALREEGLMEDPKRAKFRVASRTDKGVSALGNVIAFDSVKEIKLWNLYELNKRLEGIWFYGIKKVSSNFYPRHARMRWYRYYMHVKDDFNIEKFLEACSLFTGKHNFRNFAKIEGKKNPCRTIENIVIEWKDENTICLDFFAHTFLRHQVRKLVEALKKVGREEVDIFLVKEALNNPSIKIDFGTAEPRNLVLMNVYFDFEFEEDRDFYNEIYRIIEELASENYADK